MKSSFVASIYYLTSSTRRGSSVVLLPKKSQQTLTLNRWQYNVFWPNRDVICSPPYLVTAFCDLGHVRAVGLGHLLYIIIAYLFVLFCQAFVKLLRILRSFVKASLYLVISDT